MYFVVFIGLCLIFNSPISLGVGEDTLSVTQNLSLTTTLISSKGRFQMGFFTLDKSANYYAGIWYTQIEPQTVIWVANRDTPISSVNMDSTSLKILDGNLVLVNNAAGEFLWSTNTTGSNNSVVRATLLDTGNLVLTHGPYSNTTPPVWQSFDHPTNTFMPNAKLGYNKNTGQKQSLSSWKSAEDPSPGLFSLEMDTEIGEYVLKWNGTEQYWSSGPWNGSLFNSIPGLRSNTLYNFTYVNNDNESYYTYYFYNSAVITRFIIDISGQIRHYTWLDSSKTWNIFFHQPEKQCDVYAYCGPFGMCNENPSSFCDCLPGFRRKSDQDWGLKDFSGGCVRKAELQCGGNGSSAAADSQDRFRMITNMRLPRYPRNVTVGSVTECESACLGNCSCNAYAYDNKNGCSHWDGELLNLSEDDINGSTIYIRLAASEFLDAVQDHQNGNKKSGRLKVILPVTVAALLLILASIFTYIYYRRRNIRKEEILDNNQVMPQSGDNDIEANYLVEEHDEKHIDVPFFSFESILAATDNFSKENKLGQGGFGPVYKGEFQGGQEIAVKRLSSESTQGINEFKNEVELIAKLQHRNLVRLLGYCIKGKEKILLYEYMQHKSLDTFIFDEERSAVLDWEKRFEIIRGIARGLMYLHHDSRLRIIHRDMKTSNILLDEEMNPRISDFGLARIVEGKRTEAINTNRVAGTYGYMSPEYALDGLFSTKSDVFSFGVVMLEIITGRRSSGFYNPDGSSNLLGYAWRLWNEGKIIELVQKSLLPLEEKHESEVLKCINVGLLCVQEQPGDRPSMPNAIVMMLSTESTSLPRPNQPAFITRTAGMSPATSTSAASSGLPQRTHSRNELSATVFEGR